MTSNSNRFETLRPWQKAAVVALALILFCVLLGALGEGAVRVRQYLKHGSSTGAIEEMYRFDERLALRVPVAGFRSERVTINNLGFRGPKIAVPKPDGTVRIAFVGASTTFCAEVSGDEAVWAHKVIGELSTHFPGKRFDYVNASVPGYTLSSSLRNLELRVAPLEPDIVVIYHATNDLSANSRDEAQRKGWGGAHGETQLSWLSRYSVLSYLVEKNLMVWFAQRRAEQLADADTEPLDLSLPSIAEPFEADLLALVRKAREVADDVVLLTFSTRMREEQSPEERASAAITSLYYMPYMTLQGLIDSFSEYNRIIRRIGRQTDVLVVEGEHEIPGTAEYFVDSVHFTDLGSERMAQRVADSLISAGIVDELPRQESP